MKARTKETKTKMVLAALLSGQRISSLIMFRMFLITRLASIIFNLRRAGFMISTAEIKTKGGGHYAEYFIYSPKSLRHNLKLAKRLGYVRQ